MKSFAIVKRLFKVLVAVLCSLSFCACALDDAQTMELKTAAQKSKQPSEGTITGLDMRMCPSPCCGGWITMIDSEYYTFSDLPENSSIDLNQENFP